MWNLQNSGSNKTASEKAEDLPLEREVKEMSKDE